MHIEASAVSVLKENPKVFYSYLAEKRKVKNVISFLKDETGKSMCDPKEIADLLGKFFESTFVEEPIDEIPSLDTVKISETISDLTFDVLEVRKILKVLNISKSHGPDGIHPKLLKSLSDCPDFVTSLTQMFQSCYDEGFIPRIWKDANIIALHKKRDKLDPKNCTPRYNSWATFILDIHQRLARWYWLLLLFIR